ncbi:hypothetical protein V8E53_005708 [Lactarius tabidus]
MTTANTNLKQHIKKFHRDLWLASAQKNRWKNLDSQVSTQSVASQGRPREEFDVDKLHQYIVKFIVVDDQLILEAWSNFFELLKVDLKNSLGLISFMLSKKESQTEVQQKSQKAAFSQCLVMHWSNMN